MQSPPSSFLKMTVSDFKIQLVQQHLTALFNDPSLQSSNKLLRDFEDTLKIIAIDPSILTQTLPIILQIIQSNETTHGTKMYAINLLSIIFPYFTVEQIKTIINEDLMFLAFSGPASLQKVIADLIARAGKGEMNSKLIHNLFQSLKLVKDIGAVNSIENAIVQLAKVNDIGEEICQLANDDFYDDTLLYSRLISVSIRLLPFVPRLPEKWYIVSEDQLIRYGDVLFFQYVLSSIQTLINYADELDVKPKIEKQVDWVAALFIQQNQRLESMEGFCEYQIVDVLTTLAKACRPIFIKLVDKYGLLGYASQLQNEKQYYFMSTIDPQYLRGLPVDLPLGHKTINVFCNLISDDEIINTVEFKESVLNKLTFEEIYKIFLTLCKSKEKMQVMVERCPSVIQRMVDSNITNNEMFETDHINQLLFEISKCGLELGDLEISINKKLNGETSLSGLETITR